MKRITAIAITVAAVLGSSYVGNAAAVRIDYPVDASRLRIEGSTTVQINCDLKKVIVLKDTSDVRFFSKQIKKQVWEICYGQKGPLHMTYTFKMSQQVGAHDMLSNNSDRHPL